MNTEKEFFQMNTTGEFFYTTNYYENVYNKIINDGKDSYMDFSMVYSENKKLLTEKLGKQDFSVSDSSNRRLHVWRRSLPNGNYWIITGGNGRGTSYEVDAKIDLNDVILDMINVYDLKHLLPIISPLNIVRF